MRESNSMPEPHYTLAAPTGCDRRRWLPAWSLQNNHRPLSRYFVVAALVAAEAFSQNVCAQPLPHTGVARIGLLDDGVRTQARVQQWGAFKEQMRALGYVDGRTIVFDQRWGGGPGGGADKAARDLVHSKVDVIVTAATPAAFAAAHATSTVPIVMALSSGSAVIPALVKTLAQPGGNVTGMISFGQEMTAKRLELAREILPQASRIAIVGSATHPGFPSAVAASQKAASSLGVTAITVGIANRGELDTAFARMEAAHVDAFVVAPSGFMSSLRGPLVARARKLRLPCVTPDRRYAQAGGLAALGSDVSGLFRGAANFVDKVLKGENPATLPAERESTFELVLNLKTAKADGVTFPNTLLLTATNVIK